MIYWMAGHAEAQQRFRCLVVLPAYFSLPYAAVKANLGKILCLLPNLLFVPTFALFIHHAPYPFIHHAAYSFIQLPPVTAYFHSFVFRTDIQNVFSPLYVRHMTACSIFEPSTTPQRSRHGSRDQSSSTHPFVEATFRPRLLRTVHM